MKSHVVGNRTLSVYKYELPLTESPGDLVALRLPAGAKIMKVAQQGADPILGPRVFVWVLVDPQEQHQELRHVVTAGTGHAIPEASLLAKDWDYVDTILTMGGAMVIHVWISTPEGKGGPEVAADNL